MGADETDPSVGSVLFYGLGDLAVVAQRRCAGVNDDVVVVLGNAEALVLANVMRGAVEKPRVGSKRGGLRQPGWVPETGDFTPGLVTRAGAAVKTVKTGRRKE